ncbi:MAG TPA: nucleotide exchange factor GrpE [Saprospiraceae bacterium]|nr:nucleotide exchange factor GrpE [Saprospiraceae bacterium]
MTYNLLQGRTNMKNNIPSSLQKIMKNMKRKKNKTDQANRNHKAKSKEKETLIEETLAEDTKEDTVGKEEPKTKEEQLELELEEARDKYLRLMAEFQNFRKRASKTQLEQAENCAVKTVKQILPVVDDFDRAAEQEDFSEGVSLVYHKLKSTLEKLGVKPMQTTGEDFNPEYHEAVTSTPAPTPEMKGKIVDTLEKGYFIHDKILRFAKVVVAE